MTPFAPHQSNPRTPTLVARYWRYVDWARRSGYEAIGWLEYKALRTAKATGGKS